ncbi:unnamed protein product [Tenebrio molitor]|nr:unnamed protein product [Tenebrio molitor]
MSMVGHAEILTACRYAARCKARARSRRESSCAQCSTALGSFAVAVAEQPVKPRFRDNPRLGARQSATDEGDRNARSLRFWIHFVGSAP